MKRLLAIIAIAALVALGAAPASAARRDRGRPTAVYTTSSGTTVAPPMVAERSERLVRGKARDTRSPILKVKFVIRPCKAASGPCEISELRANEHRSIVLGTSSMRCGTKKMLCTWELEAPESIGPYILSAWSYDRAGNVSKRAWIRLTVGV